jgi:hypothetical protein
MQLRTTPAERECKEKVNRKIKERKRKLMNLTTINVEY